MDRALVLTGHFPDAKRKGSLHGLCEALLRRGWTLDVVTVGHSFISRFNPRNQWPHVAPRSVNEWVQLEPNLSSFVWRAPFHPFNLRQDFLNKIATPLYSVYPRLLPEAVRLRAETAKLILFEGPVSTMFIAMMQALAPHALLVYNAVDRMRTHRCHPLLSRYAMRYAPLLDLVRVSAEVMTADYPSGTRVVYIPQGLDKESFSIVSRNPFSTPRNVISIGDSLFDAGTLDVLATSYPDWNFHLFGIGAVPAAPKKNIMVHGEVRFANLIPYLQHADIGLAPFRDAESAVYLAQSSLRMILYTHCHLPIVAPSYAAGGRDHVCAYEPGDASSLREAFAQAIRYDRRTIGEGEVLSWDQVLEQVLERAVAAREERFTHAE